MNLLKYKKINIKLLFTSLLLLLITYLINVNSGVYVLKKLSEAIFLLTIPVAFFSVVTFFVKNNVFLSWVKVTKYFLITSFVIIMIAPSSTHGLDFFPIVKETLAVFLSIVYSVSSLFVLIYRTIKTRNESSAADKE